MEEFFVLGGLDCAVDEARGLMEGCHGGCSLRRQSGDVGMYLGKYRLLYGMLYYWARGLYM